MIAQLTGSLLRSLPGEAVIDVSGVGYRVFVPLSTYEKLPSLGLSVSLRIVTVVKEDEIALYGFFTEREEWLFNILRDVSGVGPKLAAKILSGMNADRLRDSIASGDVAGLCKIPGVGKKMAERLVVELRDKVGSFDSGLPTPEAAVASGPLSEAEDALVALGYPRPLAKKAVTSVSPQGAEPVGEIIRAALKSLAPKR